MSVRIISSISDVITNSSTEIFIINGPDALRQMVGSGVYSKRKYQGYYVCLRGEQDIIDFVTQNPNRSTNHNFYSSMVINLVGKELYTAFLSCLEIFSEKQEEIVELFKPKLLEKLKNTIIFYNYKGYNERILNRLKELFPGNSNEIIEKDGYRYLWTLD